jgi:hypothetical protein
MGVRRGKYEKQNGWLESVLNNDVLIQQNAHPTRLVFSEIGGWIMEDKQAEAPGGTTLVNTTGTIATACSRCERGQEHTLRFVSKTIL